MIMNEQDTKWLSEILEKSSWLFYGEFEVYLDAFLKTVLSKELSEFGFNENLPNDFQVAYWSVLSELVNLNLAEYGTSPRGAWLTEEGKRFAKIILENENALQSAQQYTYNKYNS